MKATGPDDGIGRISGYRDVADVIGRQVELFVPGSAGTLIAFVPEWPWITAADGFGGDLIPDDTRAADWLYRLPVLFTPGRTDVISEADVR